MTNNMKALSFFALAIMLFIFSGIPTLFVWDAFPALPFYLATGWFGDWIAGWPILQTLMEIVKLDVPTEGGFFQELWNNTLKLGQGALDTEPGRLAQYWTLRLIVGVVLAIGGTWYMSIWSIKSAWNGMKYTGKSGAEMGANYIQNRRGW